MMAITPPVTDTEISASAFGAPVANQLNGMAGAAGIMRNITYATAIPGAGVISISNLTYTHSPLVKAFLVVVSLAYSTTSAGDCVIYVNGVQAGVLGMNSGGLSAGAYVGLTSATGSTSVELRVSAWGGQPITLTIAKCFHTSLALGFGSINTLAFPT